jgi:hypothetical protein
MNIVKNYQSGVCIFKPINNLFNTMGYNMNVIVISLLFIQSYTAHRTILFVHYILFRCFLSWILS